MQSILCDNETDLIVSYNNLSHNVIRLIKITHSYDNDGIMI